MSIDVSNMLTLNCDIISKAQSRSSTGGIIDTESTLTSGVACSFRLLNGTELNKYGSENKDRLARFYFKGGTTINNTHKILFNSEYWDVEDVYNAAGKGDLLHVDARLNVAPTTSGSYDS